MAGVWSATDGGVETTLRDAKRDSAVADRCRVLQIAKSGCVRVQVAGYRHYIGGRHDDGADRHVPLSGEAEGEQAIVVEVRSFRRRQQQSEDGVRGLHWTTGARVQEWRWRGG